MTKRELLAVQEPLPGVYSCHDDNREHVFVKLEAKFRRCRYCAAIGFFDKKKTAEPSLPFCKEELELRQLGIS